jgi:hypothetical protein
MMPSAILHHDHEVLIGIDRQMNKMCYYTLPPGMLRVRDTIFIQPGYRITSYWMSRQVPMPEMLNPV